MRIRNASEQASTMGSSKPPRATGPAGVPLLVLAGAVLGCSGGNSAPTSSASCPAGTVRCPSGPCAVTAEACAGVTPMGLSQDTQGVWVGYFENVTFASGSDALRITMSVIGDQVSADVKMGGDDVPLPSSQYKGPFTAADAGWWFADAGGTSGFEVREGFTYHATDVRWEQLRLKMTVPLGEGWKDWCASFPAATYQGVTFYCPPPDWQWGYDNRDGSCDISMGPGKAFLPVDCRVLQGCSLDHCACTQTACTPTGARISLDIALRGELADGSAHLGGRDPVSLQPIPVSLRLTRVSK